jgi:hypothetical protein
MHVKPNIFETKVANFEQNSLSAFRYQYQNNEVYQSYCKHIGLFEPNSVTNLLQIPFLPISFFKTHTVKSFSEKPTLSFQSSATGNMGRSQHHISDISIYEKSFIHTFEQQFGSIQNTCILGLLPSYLEREGSSLIYMVRHLMKISAHPFNGFFLFEHKQLLERIEFLESKQIPYFIFGVSFALLDFAKKQQLELKYGKVIETGGMKGRKKEITRDELMAALESGFGSNRIFSEYGMTELLSQAYAGKDGKYKAPNWMKILVTDLNDPFCMLPEQKAGIINVIDLANIESCCFIQTSDLGKINTDGSFEILGRADHSDTRGCSLMVV